MRVDHLNSLRALEAVLRKGGLRPAAAELGVTPAAVGQHLRSLEAVLGCTLLDRHPTGAVPTDRARAVAADLTRHMAGFAEVLDRLRTVTAPNRVSLSVLPSLSETWLPAHLASLFSRLPGLDLRIDASTDLAGFVDGEHDFAIRYAREPGPELNAELLLEDVCAPVSTPGFARRYGLTGDSPSLSGVPMAEIDLAALRTTARVPGLVDWCATYGIAPPDPHSGQVTLSYSAGRRLAVSGLAIFLAGLHDVIGELETGEVVLPFGADRVLKNPHRFWLVWPKEARLSPVRKDFVRWIGDRAAEDRRRIAALLAG